MALGLSIVIIWFFWDSLTRMIGSFLGWIPWEWLRTTGAGAVNILLVYILFIIIVSLLTSMTSENTPQEAGTEALSKYLCQWHTQHINLSPLDTESHRSVFVAIYPCYSSVVCPHTGTDHHTLSLVCSDQKAYNV